MRLLWMNFRISSFTPVVKGHLKSFFALLDEIGRKVDLCIRSRHEQINVEMHRFFDRLSRNGVLKNVNDRFVELPVGKILFERYDIGVRFC